MAKGSHRVDLPCFSRLLGLGFSCCKLASLCVIRFRRHCFIWKYRVSLGVRIGKYSRKMILHKHVTVVRRQVHEIASNRLDCLKSILMTSLPNGYKRAHLSPVLRIFIPSRPPFLSHATINSQNLPSNPRARWPSQKCNRLCNLVRLSDSPFG